MRIAVIGAGISGLVTAHLLHPDHDLTIFEAQDYIGGHTNTIDVSLDGHVFPVDTGFIVFNDWTYPNFIRLLDRLGVASQPSDMSFSVACERSGLEYNGGSLGGLFAQRSNFFRPGHYRLLADILRFNRACRRMGSSQLGGGGLTLRRMVAEGGFSRGFVEHYLIPMGAAIWSADPTRFLDTPLEFFVRFMSNHGMLNVFDRPQWRVVQGGSRQYVRAITAPFRDRIRLQTPVESVRRHADHVEIRPRGGPAERFDCVILAVHSDQALAMLADPSAEERRILGAIPYHRNPAVLHTDRRVLPRRRRAWASWNYRIPLDSSAGVTVTYLANRLQSLRAPKPLCTSLNQAAEIDAAEIHWQGDYHHPVFTPAAVAAQRECERISGQQRTYFCGAYWGFGFHEDGVNSALAVCRHFGRHL